MGELRHPIRTVAQRTGLSTHVLRSWERRYQVVSPERSAGGGRLYSDADIERFLLLRRLTEDGRSIGQIAHLSTAELQELLGTARMTDGAPTEPVATSRYVGSALEALHAMDSFSLHAELMGAALALTSSGFTEDVLLPLLRRTGKLWEEGKVSSAHEHLLTVQVSRVLGWLASSVPAPPYAPNAIAVTPSGERHEFGALLAAVTAAEEGWRVTYLGPDLPAADVARAVDLRRATVVLLSAVALIPGERGDPGTRLLSELRNLHAALGGRAKIFIGGAAAGREKEAVEAAGAEWIADLPLLRLALRELSEEGSNG